MCQIQEPVLIHRYPGVRLTQKANDLFLGISLFHANFLTFMGLDSKSACYSNSGGRGYLSTDFFALENLSSKVRLDIPGTSG